MKQISLTRGFFALVDDEDFDRLSKMKWTYLASDRTGYATHYYRVGKKVKAISMHRLLMNTPAGMDTDHRNSNGLDNRRSNLRICTRTENLRNKRSKPSKHKISYKGVYPYGSGGKWEARIYCGQPYKLGVFTDPIEAAQAYDIAAIQHFGEFARLNFPPRRAT